MPKIFPIYWVLIIWIGQGCYKNKMHAAMYQDTTNALEVHAINPIWAEDQVIIKGKIIPNGHKQGNIESGFLLTQGPILKPAKVINAMLHGSNRISADFVMYYVGIVAVDEGQQEIIFQKSVSHHNKELRPGITYCVRPWVKIASKIKVCEKKTEITLLKKAKKTTQDMLEAFRLECLKIHNYWQEKFKKFESSTKVQHDEAFQILQADLANIQAKLEVLKTSGEDSFEATKTYWQAAFEKFEATAEAQHDKIFKIFQADLANIQTKLGELEKNQQNLSAQQREQTVNFIAILKKIQERLYSVEQELKKSIFKKLKNKIKVTVKEKMKEDKPKRKLSLG